jgi:hypothetical protein
VNENNHSQMKLTAWERRQTLINEGDWLPMKTAANEQKQSPMNKDGHPRTKTTTPK